jgi:predicted nuclease with TOPRIM domain
MRDKLMSRLEQLKTEFQSGETKLQDLDIQQSRLRETLLRISGAIQVLEEMLQPAKPNEEPAPQGSSPAEPPGVGKG